MYQRHSLESSNRVRGRATLAPPSEASVVDERQTTVYSYVTLISRPPCRVVRPSELSKHMPKELNFKQELTAAFGQPIAENPTQVMIEAAYRHHGLNWRYLTIEVAANDLLDAVRGARAMGFAGFNCTIPHKVAVIQYLDGLGESAQLMQAVNCVVRRGRQLIGENTDGKGFVKAIRPFLDPSGTRVVIFGAGGAARAISVEMALAGASHITIVNRCPKRGKELFTYCKPPSLSKLAVNFSRN